eukprot:gene9540-19834_t
MSRRLDFLLPKWLEDTDAYAQRSDVNLGVLGLYVVVNIFIGLVCILFFSWLRKSNPKLFALKALTPPLLPYDDIYSWIIVLYYIDEAAILKYSGFDVLFLIRFYHLALRIFVDFCIYAFIVLMPINRTGDSSATDLNSFDIWTMSNIDQNSPRLWAHIIGLYVLTFITTYHLEKEFTVYSKYRHLYLQQRKTHLRTVLVEGIPRILRSNATLATYFDLLYPHSIQHVQLCQNIKYLDRLTIQQNYALRTLERCIYKSIHTKERPLTKVGGMTIPVDAISYHTRTLSDINKAIAIEQRIAYHLADVTDQVGAKEAITVIEKYLFHGNGNDTGSGSGSGSIRRLLEARGGTSPNLWGKESSIIVGQEQGQGQEQKQDRRTENSNGNGNNSNEHSELTDDIHRQQQQHQSRSRSRSHSQSQSHSHSIQKLSFNDWFMEMSYAPTMSDCWYVFRHGQPEDSNNISGSSSSSANNLGHGRGGADEESPLLASPVERRQFLSKAFVTFKTFTSATIARQVLHMQIPGRLAISEAPVPSDIIWGNLYVSRSAKTWRSVLVETLVVLLSIIWVAPVTLISLALSGEAIRSFAPDLDELCREYFTFQVLNTFLVSTVAGSVLDAILKVINNPPKIFVLLGESLPKMGGFFVLYIIMSTFSGLGVELIRIIPFVGAFLKELLTPNKTKRDRNDVYISFIRNINNPTWFSYAKTYGQDMLIVLVCMTYSCIAPLILVAAILYFLCAIFVYKHQLLYVYEPIFETGGTFFPTIVRRIVFSLLVAQGTMLGLLILKEAFEKIVFILVLMVLTYGYLRYIRNLYESFAEHLPLDHAISLDMDLEETKKKKTRMSSGGDMLDAEEYIQPSLRTDTNAKPLVEVDGEVDVEI